MAPKPFRVGYEQIAVQARIHTLGGFSAHAGQSQLLEWISHFKKPRPRLYLVHGEAEVKSTFREFLAQQGWSAEIPTINQTIDF